MKRIQPTIFAHLTSWPQGVFTPLSNPAYRRLLSNGACWWHAQTMQGVIVGWLALELTNSAWAVSLLSFWQHLPYLFFSFFAGPIIDRVGARQVAIRGQSIFLAGFVLIALLLWSQWLHYWHLAVIACLFGFASTLEWPARSALTPDLVGKRHTVDAMLLENFVAGVARILGPFLIGWLLMLLPPAAGYGVLALLVAAGLFFLYTLVQPATPGGIPQTAPALLQVIGEGLSYVGRNRVVLAVVLMSVLMNVWIFPAVTLLPVFAREVLGQGAFGLGLLGSATGIGFLLGLLAVNHLRRRLNSGAIFMACSLLQCIMLALFALSTYYWLSWTLLLFMGIGWAGFTTLRSAIVLVAASDAMRNRAMSIVMLSIGADPPAELLTGYLAETFGAPMTVGFQAGVAVLVCIAITLLLPEVRSTPLLQATKPGIG